MFGLFAVSTCSSCSLRAGCVQMDGVVQTESCLATVFVATRLAVLMRLFTVCLAEPAVVVRLFTVCLAEHAVVVRLLTVYLARLARSSFVLLGAGGFGFGFVRWKHFRCGCFVGLSKGKSADGLSATKIYA